MLAVEKGGRESPLLHTHSCSHTVNSASSGRAACRHNLWKMEHFRRQTFNHCGLYLLAAQEEWRGPIKSLKNWYCSSHHHNHDHDHFYVLLFRRMKTMRFPLSRNFSPQTSELDDHIRRRRRSQVIWRSRDTNRTTRGEGAGAPCFLFPILQDVFINPSNRESKPDKEPLHWAIRLFPTIVCFRSSCTAW